MFCPYCAAQLSDDAKFCAGCGRTIPVPGAGEPPPAPVPETGGGDADSTAPNSDVQIGKWVTEAFALITQDFWVLVLATLVYLVLGSLIPVVLHAPLIIGFHILFINKMLTGQAELGDLFKGFDYFLPSLLALLVSGTFILLGSLACLIPGLVVGAMYVFTMPLIVDRKMEFWPAMQASHAVVKQNYLGYTFFFITLGLLQLAGALLCLVGLLVTIPVQFAAVTIAYRDVFGLKTRAPIGS